MNVVAKILFLFQQNNNKNVLKDELAYDVDITHISEIGFFKGYNNR